jgi:hypothetical protein
MTESVFLLAFILIIEKITVSCRYRVHIFATQVSQEVCTDWKTDWEIMYTLEVCRILLK